MPRLLLLPLLLPLPLNLLPPILLLSPLFILLPLSLCLNGWVITLPLVWMVSQRRRSFHSEMTPHSSLQQWDRGVKCNKHKKKRERARERWIASPIFCRFVDCLFVVPCGLDWYCPDPVVIFVCVVCVTSLSLCSSFFFSSQTTIATASVFMHVFFTRFSFKEYDRMVSQDKTTRGEGRKGGDNIKQLDGSITCYMD